MPRGVYPRGPSRATPRSCRTLRPDEPRPEGEPYRYPDRAGYVRLRWKVGVGQYVEVREHREALGAGYGRHVHHKDHDPANNDPDNLVLLTPAEHAAIHAAESRRVDVQRAMGLYEEGYSTPEIGRLLGVDASNVYRRLRDAGMTFRNPGAGSALAKRRRDVA